MGTISDNFHLKVKLKEKVYLYVNSSTQRCPYKINKTFLIEDSGGAPWAFQEFSEKILNGPNGILRGLGETDSWKKPEVKNLVVLSL